MNLSDLHRRPLSDVLAIGTPYPLVVTGGYAVQAHGLVDRLKQITRLRARPCGGRTTSGAGWAGMAVWTSRRPASVCGMKRAAVTTTPESVPAR